MTAASEPTPFHHRVWDLVAKIPRGKVASYKDVGLYAGFPRSARFVARVMKATAPTAIPWHRVVGSNGEIRIQDPRLRAEQIRRLRAEGIPVDERGKFPYAKFAWDGPHAPTGRSAAARSDRAVLSGSKRRRREDPA